MARIYELKPGVGSGGRGWAADECEEKWLIAEYAEIRGRIPATTWKSDFEMHFYELGSGISHYSLKMINTHLRRIGREPVVLVETNIGDYARNPDKVTKAKIRCALRDRYLTLGAADKIRWQESARDAASALDPPHRTFDELSATKRETNGNMGLSETEMEHRTKALKATTLAAEEAQTRDRLARVLRQLKLAKRPELVAKAIETLNPDEALDLAEQIEDQDMRDMLVERSLEAA
jgi:hypothetical protein